MHLEGCQQWPCSYFVAFACEVRARQNIIWKLRFVFVVVVCFANVVRTKPSIQRWAQGNHILAYTSAGWPGKHSEGQQVRGPILTKNKTSSSYEWLYKGNVPTFGFKSEDRYTDRYTDTRTHTSAYTPTHHPTHMPPSLMLQWGLAPNT